MLVPTTTRRALGGLPAVLVATIDAGPRVVGGAARSGLAPEPRAVAPEPNAHAVEMASKGLRSARTDLDTPTVLAWALVAVAFALVVDGLVLGPARRRALAWTR